MDNFKSWLFCIDQACFELLNNEDIFQSCCKFFKTLNYPCICDSKGRAVGIQKLIYRLSDTRENYDLEEDNYLNKVVSADIIVRLTPSDFKNGIKVTTHDTPLKMNEVTVFYIDFNCCKNERDVTACALTKIINKAFLTLNIILFRCDKEFSFGVRRMDVLDNVRSIIISKWYNFESEIQEISEYALDNFWSGNITEFYFDFGQLTLENSHLYQREFLFYYREFRSDNDYETALIDISHSYGINMFKAIEDYLNPFARDKAQNANIYDQITYEIKNIGLATIPSDTMLEMAEAELEKIHKEKIGNKYSSTHKEIDELDQKIKVIDDELFLSAEKLLKIL